MNFLLQLTKLHIILKLFTLYIEHTSDKSMFCQLAVVSCASGHRGVKLSLSSMHLLHASCPPCGSIQVVRRSAKKFSLAVHRYQLAAQTAKDRMNWMNALLAAIARSGSAGASSSKGGVPLASAHKDYGCLEPTPDHAIRVSQSTQTVPSSKALAQGLPHATGQRMSAAPALEAVEEVRHGPFASTDSIVHLRLCQKVSVVY